MKQLRNILYKVHPHFNEGGKLEKLYPVYEALDTFLYSPGEVTKGATHVRDGLDLKRMMITVAIALLPCGLMAMYNTGYQAFVAIEGGAQLHRQVDLIRVACRDPVSNSLHTLLVLHRGPFREPSGGGLW